jgi:hypothetical protein
MASARLAKELVAKIPARVGLLADVTEAIRQAGVNIVAVSAYERDGVGKFLLVTSDNAAATAALGRLNAEVTEKPVVTIDMPDEPGALEKAARTIAEAGINIRYAFGTAAGSGLSTIVFKTDDDAKAAGLF